MIYVFYALVAAALAAALTPLVRKFAFRVGAVDVPRPPRNLHSKTVAKLGGLGVFLAFAVALLLYVGVSASFDPQIVPLKFVFALLAGGAVLMFGGFLDDKYELPPYLLWIFPAAAALIVVLAGIGVGITFLSNPFGGTVSLAFKVLGIPASAIFIFIWLNGMMFTTKFLDGLDGLVAGIGLIAGLTLFALSLGDTVSQPITASFAIILSGALAGYLIYAFHPASIFFGEGGSTFVGFVLGTLSVILGGKIATALLVMGIPILDVAWVIAQRLWSGQSPFRGDRLHIHFKLLDLGFSQKQTALILYALSAVFGFTAVFLQSMGKLVALGILFGLMVVIISFVLRQFRKQRSI
ncbi:MAG TPA: MraY family glycosyltransferase [Patescibacteria group bacterium]|jgi:UDP-GlcNAc:undecaprenyl-phosphate GlcNAc-1-phosphate transferase|nr:MraY family glycosyltransferase [Patescibacteria group bacterium]